jgi:hypothetical protein
MVNRIRRRASRARERGATLFIVVLAITLLSGIGLYTVQSTALLSRASGNERQAMQVGYLAQLGVVSTLSQLATNPDEYTKMALKGGDDCANAKGLDLTKFAAPACFEVKASELTLIASTTLFAGDSFGTGLDPATNASPIAGTFLTEVTDVSYGPPIAGSDVSSRNAMRNVYAKLTTTAELHPAAASAACVTGVMQVAGQHQTRAHVILGPVGGI